MESFWAADWPPPLGYCSNFGRQEWGGSQCTHLSGCLLGLLFCILTPLHCLFDFLLHPGKIILQFLLLAKETCILRKSSYLVRQSWDQQMQTQACLFGTGNGRRIGPRLFYSSQPHSLKQYFQPQKATIEKPLAIKGILQWKRLQPLSIIQMAAWIRKEKWIQRTYKSQTCTWFSTGWTSFSAFCSLIG